MIPDPAPPAAITSAMVQPIRCISQDHLETTTSQVLCTILTMARPQPQNLLVLMFTSKPMVPESPEEAAVTVTTHVALAVPHVAVIVAVPAALAVTVPLLTVATLLLLVDHVTVPLAVAVNVPVLPTTNESVDLFKLTESVVVEEPEDELEELPTTNVMEPTYARFADVAKPNDETDEALLNVYV